MPCNPKYQSDQWTRANQVWVEGVVQIEHRYRFLQCHYSGPDLSRYRRCIWSGAPSGGRQFPIWVWRPYITQFHARRHKPWYTRVTRCPKAPLCASSLQPPDTCRMVVPFHRQIYSTLINANIFPKYWKNNTASWNKYLSILSGRCSAQTSPNFIPQYNTEIL